jgi:hypothetical protein
VRKFILPIVGIGLLALAGGDAVRAQWVSGGVGGGTGAVSSVSGTGGVTVSPITGDVIVSLSNNCPVGIDTWDGTAAKTIGATTGLLYTTGSTPIAAGRAMNLPTVASYTLGCPLTVVDLAAIFNATNVVTPTRQSSDTIDGATTGTTLGAARQSVTYVPTVAGKWATIAPPTLGADTAVAGKFVTAVPDTGIITRDYPPLAGYAITYPPGINPNSMPIANFSEARTIIGIRCNPEVLAGGVATISVYKAPSATAISAGTNLTDSASCNANSGAATDQNLTTATGANWVLAPGDRLGLVTTGTTIWTSSGVATGVVTIFVR